MTTMMMMSYIVEVLKLLFCLLKLRLSLLFAITCGLNFFVPPEILIVQPPNAEGFAATS
jgi:hypothetical protein